MRALYEAWDLSGGRWHVEPVRNGGKTVKFEVRRDGAVKGEAASLRAASALAGLKVRQHDTRLRARWEDAPDQIGPRQRSAEMQVVSRMQAAAAALTEISDYSTASMFALERFAGEGDEQARAEIRRRRGR